MNSISHSARLASLSFALLLAAATNNVAAAEAQAATLPSVAVVGSHLTESVRSAINNAVGARSPEIVVNNQGGHISLSGWAYSSAAVNIAMAAARQVDGVKSVTNNGVHLWSSRSSSDFF